MLEDLMPDGPNFPERRIAFYGCLSQSQKRLKNPSLFMQTVILSPVTTHNTAEGLRFLLQK